MGEFVLRIRLGNEAMQTTTDVADALRRLADELERDGSKYVFDLNGNKVGEWKLEGQLP